MNTRRKFMTTVVSLSALGTLPGCCLFRKNIKPVCSDSAMVSYLKGPLTIDSHCHVFNGTDLQVKEFVSRVMVNQSGPLGAVIRAAGGLLQNLAWENAPTGDQELAALTDIVNELNKCNYAKTAPAIKDVENRGFQKGKAELRAAYARTPALKDVSQKRANKSLLTSETERTQSDIVQELELVEKAESYEQYLAERNGARFVSPHGPSAQGVIAFVLQNFQYRYVTIHQYLSTFNVPGERVMDLMVPSLVDYDYWLAGGKKTKTTLADQVRVMEQLAILTGGRVHGMAPYDPLRDIVEKGASLKLVQEAVTEHGFLGVKLYPPMGFAALGNTSVAPETWNEPWLPAITKQPGFGAKLDAALTNLYTWCEKEGVPIMAHTNLSNGTKPKFEALAGSQYWKIALTKFPLLRVNFGHFGDLSSLDAGIGSYERAVKFTELMAETGVGTNTYADSGFFVSVLSQQDGLYAELARLYKKTADKGGAALANRFLYGTDWEMSLTEGGIGGYLTDFVKVMDELEQDKSANNKNIPNFSKKFFGVNAANWLGLHQGNDTRRRLTEFYAKNSVKNPDWLVKVDKG